MHIAIDTGGTFTDCVFVQDNELRVIKILSTPSNPGLAVMQALRQIPAPDYVVVRHGTTVGTNAMIERRGARVAFITTAGFEDIIAIGRQARAKLYDWFLAAPICLVPPALRFGITERTSAEGKTLVEPDGAELRQLAERIRLSGAEAAAVSLLFSFANSTNEIKVAAALEEIGIPVSVSHMILPEFREYERASTVVSNAYLSRVVGNYLEQLSASVSSEYHGKVEVMQSSGGIIPAGIAAEEPVRTMLSGPAGGVMGAYRVAKLAGFDRIITFDMGGTSTDVCLVNCEAGGPALSVESIISGIPIGIPMLDIHTAGAGGGSLARFDAGGLLRVGPESAGSDPGPVCFGRGNQVTVTDANLVLGRLDPTSFLDGAVQLDIERTRKAMDHQRGPIPNIESFASGIVRLVETSMEKAIRVISIERGHDPREFTLVAFGGGGPLHACSLAHALRIPCVVIPVLPGALSAVGVLLADSVRDYSRTVMARYDAELKELFLELEKRGFEDFSQQGLNGTPFRSVDLRYKGQGYELNIPLGDNMLMEFHCLHKQRYGFSNESRPVEIVTIRLRMVAARNAFSLPRKVASPGNGAQALLGTRTVFFEGSAFVTSIYDRSKLNAGDELNGPAIITEYTSATILSPDDSLRVDEFGNLVVAIH